MKFHLIAIGTVFLIGSFGCAPRLAQTPLGDEEIRWKTEIKKSYPAWNPPQTVPPREVPETAAAPKTVEEDINIDVNEKIDTVNPDVPAAVQPEVPMPELSNHKTYVVQKGDSLSKIARKMYNKSSAWQKIFEANRNILKDKDSLKPGMTLVIPSL
jgi:nucleoid-associated protein YgaU